MKKTNLKILLIDDEIEYLNVLSLILKENNYDVTKESNPKKAYEIALSDTYDLIITDLVMPDMTGLEILKKLKEKNIRSEIIISTGYGSIKNAIESIQIGAFSYFIKSHDPEELIMEIKKIEKIKNLEKKNTTLKRASSNKEYLMTSKNYEFSKVLSTIRKAAKSNATILLLGESGVGKEVFANYIHNLSERRDEPFVAVNCHAFSETLLESELFGHEKGAFTGAYDKRIGRFELSNGGTLFLDEIGDTSINLQAKLLRTLENKNIERIGSNKTKEIDFRLICATNKDLLEMIKEGRFREDFYFRISTIAIEIPPLRKRKEDLQDLINHFIKEISYDTKKEITKIEDKALEFLLKYDYPGNIRELKNIIERLIVLSENGIIKYSDLPELNSEIKDEFSFNSNLSLKEYRSLKEKEFIEFILKKNNYNMTKTAEALKISRRQLFNKITEYKINKE